MKTSPEYNIKKEIKSMIKEAINVNDLEDLSPLTTFDIGYIQGLKSALYHLTNK